MIVSDVYLQGYPDANRIHKSTLALSSGDILAYSSTTDLTILSNSPSEMVILNRCVIIGKMPSDDLIYSFTRETLKEDPKMPQLVNCRLIRCKLPKALYNECVYIDKEGTKIIRGREFAEILSEREGK